MKRYQLRRGQINTGNRRSSPCFCADGIQIYKNSFITHCRKQLPRIRKSCCWITHSIFNVRSWLTSDKFVQFLWWRNCDGTSLLRDILFTDSMEQNASWEADVGQVIKKFHAFYETQKVLYRSHKNHSLSPVHRELNPVHPFTPYFLRSFLMFISHLCLGLPSLGLPFQVLRIKFYSMQVTCPSHTILCINSTILISINSYHQ
jgi:hypothetical protein